MLVHYKIFHQKYFFTMIYGTKWEIYVLQPFQNQGKCFYNIWCFTKIVITDDLVLWFTKGSQ